MSKHDGKEIRVDIDFDQIESGRIDELFAKLGLDQIGSKEAAMQAKLDAFLEKIVDGLQSVLYGDVMTVYANLDKELDEWPTIRAEGKILECPDLSKLQDATQIARYMEIYPLVDGKVRFEWGFGD